MNKKVAIWKHRKWFADKGELGELILRGNNLPEFAKRVQWLSEGSLMYHLSMMKSPWVHGGIPEEHALYKEFMEYVLNNNTMGKTYKDLKKQGQHVFDGPKVKQRKRFAPATKTEKPKMGKGSYNRGNPIDEDEQLPDPPSEIFVDEKNLKKKKGKKTVEHMKESTNLSKFIEAIMTSNHAEAHKQLKDAVNSKIQQRIAQEIEKPLF